MAAPPTILVVGTLDTKFDAIYFLRSQILSLSDGSCRVHVFDISGTTKPASALSDIPGSEVTFPLVDSGVDFASLSQSEYVAKAVEICSPVVSKLVSETKIQAAIAIGGSTGSSLVTALLRRACPIGFPKLVVSTIASGNVQPYIEESDITLMYSVLDVAGVNSVTKRIFANAAGAISGMALAQASVQRGVGDLKISTNKKIAVTMFGATDPCVENIRRILTTTPHDVSAYEIYAFPATGSGGKALERLISEGQIDAVIDLTTTEIPDEICGGVFAAGQHRLESAAKKGIPMIVSVGACDIVNLGPSDTLPDFAKDRNLYHYNPHDTFMRTNKDENIQVAKYIASKLKTHAVDPTIVRVVLPKGGVSDLDQAHVEKPTMSSASPTAQTKPPPEPITGTANRPWHDAEADTALFETIINELDGSKIEVFEYLDNINDEAFAISLCEHLLEVMGIDPREYRLANARRRQWSFTHGMTIDKLRRRNSVEIPDA